MDVDSETEADSREFAAAAAARANAHAAAALREEALEMANADPEAPEVAAPAEEVAAPAEEATNPFGDAEEEDAPLKKTDAPIGKTVLPWAPKDDKVEEKLKRMGLKPEASQPGGKVKKQKGFYSEENVRKRLELMEHPDIVELLEKLWLSANTDATDAIIDHDEYLVMHRKSESLRHTTGAAIACHTSAPRPRMHALTRCTHASPFRRAPRVRCACSVLLALDPTTTPAGALRQAESDWKRDSEGTPGLDQTRFYWTWFELADLYTTSIDADEYVAFLSRMLAAIVREDKATGMIMWQEDRRIIEE